MSLAVLITNIVVGGRSGTEVVTEQLADGLRRAGHRPVVYTSRAGVQAEAMRGRGHLVIDRLAALPWRPDVIHGHHNATTMAAVAALPGVPALFTCHDAGAAFDAPPLHPRIRRYLAVDELCRARLVAGGVAGEAVVPLPNAVDEQRHRPRGPLPPRPGCALALAKNTGHLAALRSACAAAGVALDELGHGVGRVSDEPWSVLPRYDLVFATARMALEAAFAGCAVVVCDARGMAGPLTTATLPRWRDWNFGRGILAQRVSEDSVQAALAAYDAADAAEVSAILRRTASLADQIRTLEALYRAAIEEQRSAAGDGGAAEAAALGRFLEDYLPSAALERPWRGLALGLGGAAADGLLPLVERFRDEVIARLDGALAAQQHASEDRLRAATQEAADIAAMREALRTTRIAADRFRSQQGRLAGDCLRCDLGGVAGHVVYGPYERLPPGDYEVAFDFACDGVRRRREEEITIEAVANAERVLASRVIPGGADPARGDRTLRFAHDREDDMLEFRIAASGFAAGVLRFGGVGLRRVEP